MESVSSKNKFKHIIITEDNYEKLKEHGKAGDSFNDVLTRILANIQTYKQVTGLGRI